MIGGLGTTELIIILVIVLVIFGAGRLPEVGGALGKGIRNFRRASKGEEDLDITPEGSSQGHASLDDSSASASSAQAESVDAGKSA